MRNYIKNIIYIRRILLVSLLSGMNCGFAMAQTLEMDTLVQNSINRIAYGTQPKWMTTSAVSSVKGSELKSFVPNIANMLNGRIPGLVVQQWGCEPGADAPAMNARGINTYGSGTGLFIVIDGFQSTEAYFQQLTPQEIESITLLKDASATAIYGTKGANGVLLITTKRGTSDKIKINFSIQSGFQQPIRLPEFLGAYDYATLYNEALVNDGKSPLYTPMDLEAYKSGYDPIFHPDVDWYETVLRKAAPITNYNFTASGSNEYFRYFVLLNVLDDKSLYRKAGNVSDFSKNGTYTRYNFRTNIDVKLSKRLQGAVTLGGTIEDKTNPGTSENTSGMFDLISSVAPNAFPVYVSTGMYGGNSMYSNPLGDLMQTGYTSYNGRALQAIFQLKGDLDFITPGLSISGAVGFNTYFKSYSKKSRQYTRYSVARDNANEIIYTAYGQNTSLAGDESGSSQWRDYSLQASLNYNRTFNEIHNIDAMYLGSYNDYVVTGSDLSYKNIAMGGRMTYTYDKRYIGEFSFGYNGTENFPKGHRFGFFPAGSLGWILSNESFLKGNSVLNYMKLRTSYGIVGNDNIGGIRYMFDQYYDGYGYHLGNSNNTQDGLVQGKLANSSVTWEKEKKFNIGIETTLINKINVSFDYFIQKRSNILSQPYQTVPDYLGISRPDVNIGKVDNKGFEASIRYNGLGKKDLTYFIETSFWYAKNKITYNSEAIQENEYLYGTGRMVGQPFVLEAIGFFKDENDVLKSPTQTFADVRPGDIKYKDQNNDGKIDSNDYYPMGYTSMPQMTLGLHGGMTFKGFDLDIFFQGAANRTVYCSGKYYHAFQNDGKVSSVAVGRWTPETAETATYPRLSSENNLNNYQASSFWQKNGNFLKLRSLEIGYTLPFQFSRKINLEKVRVFANGTNLFSLDHMDGFTDPETMSGYPALRTISFGLSVQL